MNEMQFFQFTLTFTDMNACNFFWIKKQDLWNYIP